MGRLDEHLGKGEVFEIDGDPVLLNNDKQLIIKPLGMDSLNTFIAVAKSIGDVNPKDKESGLDAFDNETIDNIKSLIRDSLKKGMGEEDEDTREAFGMKYMSELLNVIMSVNLPKPSREDTKKEEIISKLKKNAQPDPEDKG